MTFIIKVREITEVPLHTAKAKSATVVLGLHLDQIDHKTSCVTSEWFTTLSKDNFLGNTLL